VELACALLNNLSDQADVEESAEWYLRSYLVDYKRTLLRRSSAQEIEFATGALMRFCAQALDTSSALYRDCTQIAEAGSKVAEQLKAG
jgi:nitrate reductase alpha subunit